MKLKRKDLSVGDEFYSVYAITGIGRYFVESIADKFGAPKLWTSVWDRKEGNFVDPEEDRLFLHGLFSTEWEAWDCVFAVIMGHLRNANEGFEKYMSERKMEAKNE